MVEAGNGGIYLIQLKYRAESEDILMNKVAKLLSFIIVLSMVVTHTVALPVEVNAIAMGQYIIGDGSGGGGGGGGGSPGAPGDDGDTNEHRYNDSTEAIINYFSESILRTILINYPEYGAGNDIINGGSESNELFGLGGNDTFIVDSADNANRNRIWDFKSGDVIQLKTENSLVSTEAMGIIGSTPDLVEK